jgi:broad specificity phosphatase PhoE
MAAKTLHFVRHGEAEYNVLNWVNAHAHVPNKLTATGREQAACCGLALAGVDIALIYCSAFPRALQTAEIINQQFNVPILVDTRINETGAFAFEGKPVHLWHAANVPDRLTAVVPDCEPLSEMKLRLHAFLDMLRGTTARHIAVVSHAEPIQMMLGNLNGLLDSAAKQRAISHCFPISIDLEN